MFICKCRREFKTLQGLGYHKNFCGMDKISFDGYYQYYIGSDAVYIHRKVMEQKLGRKLRKGDLVHHIDGNTENNDPSNLQLTNSSLHAKHHYEIKSPEWKEKFKNHNPTGKGRKLKGSQLPQSKLTEKIVKEIKYC